MFSIMQTELWHCQKWNSNAANSRHSAVPFLQSFSVLLFVLCSMPCYTTTIYDECMALMSWSIKPLQWRHNGGDSISNHQPHDCLLNRLFRRRSKKTSKLRVTGLCVGNSPGTGEFPAQMASYAENVSIWWRHQTKLTLGSVFLLQRIVVSPRSKLDTWYGVQVLE